MDMQRQHVYRNGTLKSAIVHCKQIINIHMYLMVL